MRVLVAYGTRWGSTEDVAKEIASLIRKKGIPADTTDLGKNDTEDLEPYEMVVIGSGIAYGSWSKGALRFLERNSKILSEKRLAMFACCGDLLFDPSKMDEYESKYLRDVARKHGLEPFSLGLFGGVIDFDRYSFLVKGILSMRNAGKKDMQEKGIDIEKPYDFRDWEKIRAWGDGLLEDD
ncbi:MAG: flavodoxin domain-containing protein [Methanomassiliicoccales archaeon]